MILLSKNLKTMSVETINKIMVLQHKYLVEETEDALNLPNSFKLITFQRTLPMGTISMESRNNLIQITSDCAVPTDEFVGCLHQVQSKENSIAFFSWATRLDGN